MSAKHSNLYDFRLNEQIPQMKAKFILIAAHQGVPIYGDPVLIVFLRIRSVKRPEYAPRVLRWTPCNEEGRLSVIVQRSHPVANFAATIQTRSFNVSMVTWGGGRWGYFIFKVAGLIDRHDLCRSCPTRKVIQRRVDDGKRVVVSPR